MAIKKNFSSAELDKMSKDDIIHEFRQLVYNLCLLAEKLEHQDRFRGSGQRFAENMAKLFGDILCHSWNEKEEKKRQAKATMDFIRDKYPETKDL